MLEGGELRPRAEGREAENKMGHGEEEAGSVAVDVKGLKV